MVAQALAIDFETPPRARLALGKILTSFAAWSFAIGLAVYGFEAHGIAGVGVVALIRYLPGAIGAPFAGAMIDRDSRRNVMVAERRRDGGGPGRRDGGGGARRPDRGRLHLPRPLRDRLGGLRAGRVLDVADAGADAAAALGRERQRLGDGELGQLLGAIGAGFLLTATSPAFLFGVCAAPR